VNDILRNRTRGGYGGAEVNDILRNRTRGGYGGAEVNDEANGQDREFDKIFVNKFKEAIKKTIK